MNKSILLLFSLLISTTSFYSCKKGPDDPLISLTPRNWKITGTWKLEDLQSDYTILTNSSDSIFYVNDESAYTIEFDGSELTTVIANDEEGNSIGGSYTFNSTATIVDEHSQELTINKDGTYRMITTTSKKSYNYTDSEGELITDTYSGEDSVSTQSGQWHWADGKKEKTWLVLDDVGYFLFRLSNKEMKWERTWEDAVDETAPNSSDNYSNSGVSTHTWAKQ